MTLRPEKRAAIQGLLAHLRRVTGNTYRYIANPDPPDVVAEELPTGRVLVVEHTRLVPRDVESIESWRSLSHEVQTKSRRRVPGTFFMGPAAHGERVPRKGQLLKELATEVVRAVSTETSWAIGAHILLPAQDAGEPQLKVTMVSTVGSIIIGLPALGHKVSHEVIDNLRKRIDKQMPGLHTCAADERILLIDVTRIPGQSVGRYEAHVHDKMEYLREEAAPAIPIDKIYFSRSRQKDSTQAADVWLVWPR